MSLIKSAAAKIGIDRAIAYTVFSRIIQALGGVGTVIFIARYLTKNQQGYYYTFGSIIAIQVFFELGLNSIITQYVAHEMAHLSWKDDVNTSGEASYQSRVASLLHFCVKWFGILSIFCFVILMAAGFYFFSKYNNNSNVNWKGPWIILSVTTSGYLVLDPITAFLTGLGKVKEMARIGMLQQTSYIVFVIVLLISGFNLYASALASFIGFISVAGTLLFSNNFKILVNLWKLKAQWSVNYFKEIFPYQWKIALSWISGYFIFQLFNPVLFASEGPVVAGQMGMTLTALNGISGLSMSWINTKVPLFSSLIAKANYKQLDATFFKSFVQSLIITAIGLCILYAGVTLLHIYGFPIGKRFLSSYPLAFMCISYFMSNVAFGLATYLRCHKKEPLLLQAVVFAVLTASSTLILGKTYGLFGITAGYLTLMLTVGIPWVIIVFVIKRKQWHQLNYKL